MSPKLKRDLWLALFLVLAIIALLSFMIAVCQINRRRVEAQAGGFVSPRADLSQTGDSSQSWGRPRMKRVETR